MGRYRYEKKQKHYDDLAASAGKLQSAWSYTAPGHRARVMAGHLERLSPSWYLNVGCGNGHLELHTEFRCIALDISMGMCRTLPGPQWGVYPVQAGAEELPFAAESVPCIVTDGTYQGLVGKEVFLSGVARVLHPGGTLLLGIVGKRDIWTRANSLVQKHMGLSRIVHSEDSKDFSYLILEAQK